MMISVECGEFSTFIFVLSAEMNNMCYHEIKLFRFHQEYFLFENYLRYRQLICDCNANIWYNSKNDNKGILQDSSGTTFFNMLSKYTRVSVRFDVHGKKIAVAANTLIYIAGTSCHKSIARFIFRTSVTLKWKDILYVRKAWSKIVRSSRDL